MPLAPLAAKLDKFTELEIKKIYLIDSIVPVLEIREKLLQYITPTDALSTKMVHKYSALKTCFNANTDAHFTAPSTPRGGHLSPSPLRPTSTPPTGDNLTYRGGQPPESRPLGDRVMWETVRRGDRATRRQEDRETGNVMRGQQGGPLPHLLNVGISQHFLSRHLTTSH